MTTNKEKLTVKTAPAGAGENAIIRRISLVGIIGNIFLSAFKLFAGIAGSSGAMVSDAVPLFLTFSPHLSRSLGYAFLKKRLTKCIPTAMNGLNASPHWCSA